MRPPGDPQPLEPADRQLRAALAALATAKDAVSGGMAALPHTRDYLARSVLDASMRNLDFETQRIEEVRRGLTRSPDSRTTPRPW